MAYRIESEGSRSWAVTLNAFNPAYLAQSHVIEITELDMLLEMHGMATTKLTTTNSYKVKRIMLRHINEINIKIDRLINY